MAGQPDGSIVVETKLDSTGFDRDSRRMETAIRSLVTKVNSLGPAFQRALGGSEGAVASFQSRAAVLREQIADMQRQLEAMGRKQTPTAEYAQISTDVEKAEAAINRLIDKQEKYEALGVDKESAQWRSLQYDLEQAIDKYNELVTKKQELEASGSAYQSGAGSTAYAEMVSAIEEARARLAAMENQVQRVNRGTQGAGGFMRGLASAAGTVARHLARAARTVASGLLQGIRSAVSHMARLGSHARSSRNQFSGLISTAKKFTLSLLGARGVFALLRKAVSAYMQENQALASTLSSCWSGIGNILGPIITRLINLVASAVAWVTAFLKLFGIVGKSTTKAIGAAGGAAKKETDALKKQLASFDELNVLSDNSSDGGGGGGGGGAGTTGLPEVEMPDWVKLMVDQIKAGNWAAAATTLATQLNGMVDRIDWTGLGQKIGKGLDGALTFLATFIKSFNWFNLGANLASGVNEILNTVDWGNLGTILSAKFRIIVQTAAGFLLNLDWSALAKGFSDFAIQFFNGITEAVSGIDWQQLGRDIAQFLREVDWSGIFDALCGALGAVLGGLGAFLLGLFEEPMRNLGDWLYDISHEDGKFCAEGLFEGLLLGLLQFQLKIQTWVYDHIFKPFWDGLCSAFGIASPSTEMAKIGDYCIQGLLQGISDAWGTITRFFSTTLESVKTAISNTWSNVKLKTSEAWSGIKSTISEKVSKLKTDVSDGFGKIKETMSDKMQSALTLLKEKDWGSVGSAICNGISNGINAGWSWLKNTVSNLATNMLDKAKQVLDIHSPSGVFRDEVGFMIGAGVGEGVEKSKSAILPAVKRVAAAISDELQKCSYTLDLGVDDRMDRVNGKISDAPLRLMNQLQAIADRVAFVIPTPAMGSIVPPGVLVDRGGGNGDLRRLIEEVDDDLANVIASAVSSATVAVVEAVRDAGDRPVYIDGDAVTAKVRATQSRRDRMFGRKPVLV